MDALLPIFPLQLVVFPNESLNLHIFEPRYLQLIRECEEEGITFGVPAYIEGEVMPICTEIHLREVVKRYPDGASDIRTVGGNLFRIIELYPKAPDKLYAGAQVEPIEITLQGNLGKSELILEKAAQLFELLSINKPLPQATDQFSVFQIAHHLGLNITQEYELLTIRDEEDRQDFVLAHFERILPVIRQMNDLQEKVKLNGHFRNLRPPKF